MIRDRKPATPRPPRPEIPNTTAAKSPRRSKDLTESATNSTYNLQSRASITRTSTPPLNANKDSPPAVRRASTLVSSKSKTPKAQLGGSQRLSYCESEKESDGAINVESLALSLAKEEAEAQLNEADSAGMNIDLLGYRSVSIDEFERASHLVEQNLERLASALEKSMHSNFAETIRPELNSPRSSSAPKHRDSLLQRSQPRHNLHTKL